MLEVIMRQRLAEDVASVFAAYPLGIRRRMLALRQLIFETAARTEGVGEIVETLKWGEPAYLTLNKTGTTLRLGWKPRDPARYALYVNCQTDLVARFRDMFAPHLTFEGNRAIIFDVDETVPTEQVAICVAAALTYHRRKTR
jgi:hypothetical protein